MRKIYIVLKIALCLILLSCGGKSKKNQLVIGISPSSDAERTNERIDAITAYFSKELGMEVSHVLVSNPSAMIEAMRANKIHVGSGGPFTYLVAAEKAGAEAIVTTKVPEGHTDYYRTLFITQPNSPINNLEDLKRLSKQTTLSWAYPTSCSGHLVPRYVLQQHGIYPEDFKEVFTSTDHTSAIFTALSGKVDVAAVYKSGIHKFVTDGRIKESDFKIIWESEPLLASPTFVRKDLPEDLKKKIQNAYINMKKNSPETWQILRNQYSFEINYVPIHDTDYNVFRKMANEIKDLGFDLNTAELKE